MSQSKSTDTQNKQSANESEADAAKRKAGVTEKSSHDKMSNVKAGNDGKGAGGGAKQERKH